MQAFGDLDFLGYHSLSVPSVVTPGADGIELIAAWRVNGPPRDLNFFVHALGPDGLLYGQQDVSVPASRYGSGEVLAERYTITLLPEAAPGTYTLSAGAYLPDGTRLAETLLTTFAVVSRTAPPVTARPQFRTTERGILIGQDADYSLPGSPRFYQHWQTPSGYFTTVSESQSSTFNLQPSTSARYVPFGHHLVLTDARFSPAVARSGETVTVDVEFIAARSLVQDLIAKVELTGNGWRAQMDTVPVGGGLPTLKWIAGSRLRDRYTLTLPADVAPGPALLTLGWYDAFTQRTLPLLDPRLAQLGVSALLGTVEIED
jgi:hypothetical protein